MDRNIREQFSVGGTGVHVHKYIGPAYVGDKKDPAQPNYVAGTEVDPLNGDFIKIDVIINETKVQDLLFMVLLIQRTTAYTTRPYIVAKPSSGR